MSGNFGRVMFAAAVVVVGLAALEQYNTRLAFLVAVSILLGLAVKNPRFIQELGRLVNQGTTGQERQ